MCQVHILLLFLFFLTFAVERHVWLCSHTAEHSGVVSCPGQKAHEKLPLMKALLEDKQECSAPELTTCKHSVFHQALLNDNLG
jgi:hypothetical protein